MTRAGEKLYRDPQPPRGSFLLSIAFFGGVALGLVGLAGAIVTIAAFFR
jgi:hypothetical protein